MNKKVKLFIVILSIVLIVGGIGILGYYCFQDFKNIESQKAEKNTENEENNKEDDSSNLEDENFVTYKGILPEISEGGKIISNNDIVQKLYNYLEVDFISKHYDRFSSYENDNFYMDKLTTYDTLSDEAKLYYAYNTIENVQRIFYDDCNDLKTYSFYKAYVGKTDLSVMCLDNNKDMISHSGTSSIFYDVDKEKIEKAYHQVFGDDKQLPLKDFTIDSASICLYSKEKDNFLCFNDGITNWKDGFAVNKFVQAVLYEDRIEIYDRYIWYTIDYSYNSDGDLLTYYKSRYQNEIIEQIRDSGEKIPTEEQTIYAPDNILEQGALYKHTFKKDNNGKYYWYSSERI